MLYKLLYKILERNNNQLFWQNIFQLSLRKMNYGNGGNYQQSGELFVVNFIAKHFKNETELVVFDVGANIGQYAKAIAHVFGNVTKIYSFEPSEKTFKQFVNTTSVVPNIMPHNFGFSDKEYSQKLFSNKEASGLASLYQRKLDHFGINMDVVEEIKLTTIDLFCERNKIERINFLKLDVEGHELSALKGARNMIEKGRIDFIQFEFGGCNIDSRTFFQDFYYLLKDQYKLYRILENGLFELVDYKETYEIFITINYLAI